MIQTFKLNIETANDAVQTRTGIWELLRNAAERIYHGCECGYVYDRNGNQVGTWEIVAEEEEE